MAEAKLNKYGEIYSAQAGKHRIVVRAIWGARGDYYHARILSGDGTGRKAGHELIKWQGDYKIRQYGTAAKAKAAAIAGAKKAAAKIKG